MAVPRNRTSNARKNSRRAHHAKTVQNLSSCSNCKKPQTAHHICTYCGFYAGRLVIQGKSE